MRPLTFLSYVLAAVLLLAASTPRPAASEPLTLSDAQMDSVTAGIVATTFLAADAFGDIAEVKVNFNGVAKQRKNVDVVKGRAVLRARAFGEEGAFAFTDADVTFADYDIALINSKSKLRENRAGTVSVARLRVRYKAWDWVGLELSAPLVIDVSQSREIRRPLLRQIRELNQLNRNIATLDLDVQALGTDTLVDVQTSVTAIEQALSSVQVYATYGVDRP